MRVLVVEDERDLARAIERGLRHEGMAVDVALDGAEAMEKSAVNRYDVMVLDRNLPALHGDEVCRNVRAATDGCRVLMLTAAGGVADRVAGLSLGADDYLPKPFHFVELVARIRALGRRPAQCAAPVLARGGVTLDPARHTAERDGVPLRMTRKEFAVLEVLLQAEGAVVSAEDLLERAWDEHADPLTNVVRVTVMTLRRALGAPPIIETVVGAGYRIP